ncbi:Phosphatidylglycerol/phosphatidylinositol transfer protein [Kappamyces sp. JEL0829]|nr:Phosphatidylglycerol/phosphatidylinositol transfer protein [Kappamyces sp. JEL0829]KAJ3365324.1 Phosphatidylglycerol/phosphatidylinositol transfer protein [Kappamyces sp. JEL0680]
MKFFTTALVALVSAAVGQNVTTCNANTHYSFSLQTADIQPFPVVIGGNVTVSATGSLDEGVSIADGATYKIQLKVGSANGVTVYTETQDFCKAAATAGFPCPIASGPQAFSVSQAVPSAAPAGKYFMVVTVYNTDKSVVACLTGPVTLTKPAVARRK